MLFQVHPQLSLIVVITLITIIYYYGNDPYSRTEVNMWHTLLQQLLQCCSIFAEIAQLEAIVTIIMETGKITNMVVYNVQQTHQK